MFRKFHRQMNKIEVFIERRSGRFFLLALFFFIGGFLLLPKIYRFSGSAIDSFKQKKQVEERTIVLENRKNEIEKELEILETDFGLESEIRNKFPVVREGEEMVVFLDSDLKNNEDRLFSKKSWWQRFKDWFKIGK